MYFTYDTYAITSYYFNIDKSGYRHYVIPSNAFSISHKSLLVRINSVWRWLSTPLFLNKIFLEIMHIIPKNKVTPPRIYPVLYINRRTHYHTKIKGLELWNVVQLGQVKCMSASNIFKISISSEHIAEYILM